MIYYSSRAHKCSIINELYYYLKNVTQKVKLINHHAFQTKQMVITEERVSLRWIRESDIKQVRLLINNLESLKRKSETLKGQLGFIDTAFKQGSGLNAPTLDKQHYNRIQSDLCEVERLSRSMSRLIIGDLATTKRILNKIK